MPLAPLGWYFLKFVSILLVNNQVRYSQRHLYLNDFHRDGFRYGGIPYKPQDKDDHVCDFVYFDRYNNI